MSQQGAAQGPMAALLTPEFLANPKNHRTRPSIYVASPGAKVVVDTDSPEIIYGLQKARDTSGARPAGGGSGE